MNTKDKLIDIDPKHPKLKKINDLLSQLEIKMKKFKKMRFGKLVIYIYIQVI